MCAQFINLKSADYSGQLIMFDLKQMLKKLFSPNCFHQFNIILAKYHNPNAIIKQDVIAMGKGHSILWRFVIT